MLILYCSSDPGKDGSMRGSGSEVFNDDSVQVGMVTLMYKSQQSKPVFITSIFLLYGTCLCDPTPGWVLPYLGMVGRFRDDYPCIFYFKSDWSLFDASSRSDVPPLSVEKIGLSLSHLVPEILEPKVGLLFHQNILFNNF